MEFGKHDLAVVTLWCHHSSTMAQHCLCRASLLYHWSEAKDDFFRQKPQNMNPQTKKVLWVLYVGWILVWLSVAVWSLVMCVRAPQRVTLECPANGTCTAETVQVL